MLSLLIRFLACKSTRDKEEKIMPRPKQKEELKRCCRLTIRLEESEYAKIINESNELGITPSTYIRSKTMRGYVNVPKYAQIDSDHINQLSRLGGLMKKIYNETGGLYQEKTGAILDEIYEILSIIRKRLEDDRKAHPEP
jgi:hypothetical protein